VEAVPVVARGHNVAAFIPPMPRALGPLLAAVPAHPLLILTSSQDRALDVASAAAPLQVVVADTAPAAPLPGDVAAVAAGLADALGLLRASALRVADFAAVVLAWPEEFDAEGQEALEAVMAEADKQCQRLIATAVSDERIRHLIERYAFKAMTFGFPAGEAPGTAPVGPARYVLCHAALAERTMLLVRTLVEAGVAVARCPLSRDDAATLAGVQPPVVVLGPEELPWARTLFQPLTPFPMPSRAAALDRRSDRVRGRLEALASETDLDRELLLLAPLLARHDPAVLAAAALRLALEPASPKPSSEPVAGAGAFTRVWVGIGRKDSVRPGDLVGALTKEVGLPAGAIGKIDVRELFCLVEVQADAAERAARGLAGVTVRGRRLTARLDRGPSGRAGGREGGRGTGRHS